VAERCWFQVQFSSHCLLSRGRERALGTRLIVAMQCDVKRTSLFVPQSLEFSWALIGQCNSESVRVFQRIVNGKDAGFPTVCAGSNIKSKSKVVFYLSACITLSFERGETLTLQSMILCELKEKIWILGKTLKLEVVLVL